MHEIWNDNVIRNKTEKKKQRKIKCRSIHWNNRPPYILQWHNRTRPYWLFLSNYATYRISCSSRLIAKNIFLIRNDTLGLIVLRLFYSASSVKTHVMERLGKKFHLKREKNPSIVVPKEVYYILFSSIVNLLRVSSMMNREIFASFRLRK